MEQVHLGETRLSIQVGSMAIAAIFLLGAMQAGYRYIGWPPVVIVGGSGSAAFILWSLTYLRRPLPPAVVLPAFPLHPAQSNPTSSPRESRTALPLSPRSLKGPSFVSVGSTTS